MRIKINPLMIRWGLFNSMMFSFALFLLSVGMKGNFFAIIVAILFVGLLAWGIFFARPPSFILMEDDFILSLFFFKIRLPYSSIKSISLSNIKMPIMEYSRPILIHTRYISPKFFYYFVVFIIILTSILFWSKGDLEFNVFIKLSSVFLSIAVIYHLFICLISKITYRETNLNIAIDPSLLSEFPFTYYRKYPLFFRLNMPFIDLSKSQICDFISALRLKLDSKVFHSSIMKY